MSPEKSTLRIIAESRIEEVLANEPAGSVKMRAFADVAEYEAAEATLDLCRAGYKEEKYRPDLISLDLALAVAHYTTVNESIRLMRLSSYAAEYENAFWEAEETFHTYREELSNDVIITESDLEKTIYAANDMSGLIQKLNIQKSSQTKETL